jgi:hypothetical protein
MKKKLLPIFIALIVIGVGVVGYTVLKKSPAKQPETVVEVEQLAVADSSIIADVRWSKVKDNTIVLSITGLKNGYTKVAYEISYETLGVVQGVTASPLDITGKETFTRDDIYLGTCSRNVCRPHTGVKKVSLVLEFTDTSGKKSQLTKDFDL